LERWVSLSHVVWSVVVPVLLDGDDHEHDAIRIECASALSAGVGVFLLNEGASVRRIKRYTSP
jgi:hypothetical protein